MQELIFTDDPAAALGRLLRSRTGRVFMLADENTAAFAPSIAGCTPVVVPAGDDNKTLKSARIIWQAMVDGGATRLSTVVNFGGGMISDLGGFAAATFKRGISFINVPTTLLAAVDAAVGGKTGINFAGLKNEIGVFREADAVVISATYFSTLPRAELMSGYAEMVKHSLIADAAGYGRLIAVDPAAIPPSAMLELLRDSVEIKRRIVSADPSERGIRKALNLGHTVGHAFEEFALLKSCPLPHGAAVAHGLLAEMVIANLCLGFPSDELYRYAAWLQANYAPVRFTCDDYPQLLGLMAHDKKNASPDAINFTLLAAPADPRIDCTATLSDITAALDIFRDLLSC
ncbi:MAG: 3-dehydroquinate synthase [Muribaculaceae bacterium]|nr:3-dehydroquinate synthase [Muribaculaceae bacterium]MDE6315539.1 3-dehydroquinate synthase [Muribaculaceae bacterium]